MWFKWMIKLFWILEGSSKDDDDDDDAMDFEESDTTVVSRSENMQQNSDLLTGSYSTITYSWTYHCLNVLLLCGFKCQRQ